MVGPDTKALLGGCRCRWPLAFPGGGAKRKRRFHVDVELEEVQPLAARLCCQLHAVVSVLHLHVSTAQLSVTVFSNRYHRCCVVRLAAIASLYCSSDTSSRRVMSSLESSELRLG